MSSENHSPLSQFEIKPYVDIPFGKGASADKVADYLNISFTNSSLWMSLSVISIALFLLYGMRTKSIIPGRLQSLAEMSYEFIVDMVRSTVGTEGKAFFPLIFSLFMFIAACNLLGMIPYSFTVTSHIIVTFALAIFIFLTVMVVSIYKNGFKFFRHFCPEGTPLFIAPLLIVIEIFAYLARPISLSLRLAANMMAGHVLLKVIAGLTSQLGIFFFVPLGFIAMMTGFEIFVALLQAYIFTILTCVYLNDAIHMH